MAVGCVRAYLRRVDTDSVSVYPGGVVRPHPKVRLTRRAASVGIVVALMAGGAVALPASRAAGASPPKPDKQGTAAGKPSAAPASATASARQFDAPADVAPANPIPAQGPGGSSVDGPGTVIPSPPVKGFDSATSREVPEKRRADTRVFANADGTFTADIHSRPIHFRDETGKWEDIDPALRLTPTGRAQNASGPLKVDLAPRADDALLAKMVTETGHVFGYGLAGATQAPMSINGSEAVYRDALPHVDVRLTVRDNGVKEDLVLKSRSAPRRFVFPLTLDGLSASLDSANNSVALSDAEGNVALRIPPGWMEDSNYNPRSDESPKSDGVRYALVPHAQGSALEVTLDDAWLDDPARVYPVTVDPTTADYIAGQDDTYVATYRSWNGYTDTELKVGTADSPTTCAGSSNPGCGGSHFHQSYLHFNGADALDGYHVQSAFLNIYEIWSASCAPRGMGVYRVTEGWGWMTDYPGATFDPGVKAWANFAMGYSAACPPGNAGFNVTEFVDGWSRNVYPNYGLTLRVDPGSENDNMAWKKFASFDNNVSTDPYLRVTYSPYHATYACGPPTPCKWTTPLTSQTSGWLPITVTNKGKDTWPAGGAFRLAYHVLAADNTTVVVNDGQRTYLPAAVAPGQSITLQAGVAPLAAGSYHLHFDMVHEGVTWFSSEGVPKLDVPVTVYNPNPTIKAVAPLGSSTTGTLTPTLAVTAVNNNPSYGALKYDFKLCSDIAMSVKCITSTNAGTAWGVPSSHGMTWGKTYYWTIKVTDGANLVTTTTPIPMTTAPTQPTTSMHLGADPYSSGLGGVSPGNGNFGTSVTDVNPATAGPTLSIHRTYNAQDPRVLPFGTGWSTQFDMTAIADPDSSVVVSYPDGHQVRFGKNPDNSYASGPGVRSVLTGTPAAGLTLNDTGGVRYVFTAAGRLAQVSDADGLTKSLTYDAATGRLTKVTASSGRSLNFTWTGTHITEVATDPLSFTAANAPYKWTYAYNADLLTQVCNARAVGPRCTDYGYQAVTGTKTTTPYSQAVLADTPKGFWRMSDDTSSAVVSDSSGNALNGTYVVGVTKGVSGGVPNDPDKAVTFGGTAGHASVPSGFANFTQGLAIEAWVYPTSGSSYARIADFGNGAGVDNVVFAREGTGSTLRFSSYKGTSSQALSAPNALVLNEWQHVAVSLSGAGIATIYRNGQAVATGPVHVPNSVTRTSNLIGKSNWAGDGLWAGKIDDLAVYDHPLTPESVAAHYSQAQGPVRPTSTSLLSTITLPEGNVNQTVHYAPDHTVDYRKDGVQKQWSFSAVTAANTAVRTTTVTDPQSKTTKWRHDLQGRLVERVDELGNSRRFSYDRTTNVLSRMIDENGHVVAMSHDGEGNVLTRTTAQTSAYANKVVADGATSYWRLGEANGTTAKDSAAGSASGTYSGGYSLAQAGGIAELDTSATFDGTGHVQLSSGFANFTGGMTVEAWVYPTAASSWARVVDLGNGPDSDNIAFSREGTSTNLRFDVYRGATGKPVVAQNALVLDQWQHIAATLSAAGAVTIYRNGQVVGGGSGQTPNNLPRTSNFIGKSNWSAHSKWQGGLDEVAVYPIALTSATVASHYSQGATPWGETTSYDYYSPYASEVLADSPKAYWRLGDRTGTKLYDATEHGYTATKTSAVTLGTPGAMPLEGDSAASFSGALGGNAGATVVMPQTNATLETWVYLPDTLRSGPFITVGAGGNGYSLGVGSGTFATAGNHLIGLYEPNRWIDSGFDIGTGWHHVAMTIDGTGTAGFYIDGAHAVSKPGTVPVAGIGTMVTLGGYTVTGTNRYFNGTLDEPAIYSSVLSASRIQQHYNTGKAASGTDPRLNKMTAVRDARSTWRHDNTYRTRYGYDTSGHLISKTTAGTPDFPAGRTSTWTYTAGSEPGFGGIGSQPKGLVKSATTPRATTTSYAYDSKGDVRQIVDAVGLTTTFTYDDLGRRTSAIESSDAYPAGLTTTWEYDELSRVVSTTSPSSKNAVTNVVHTPKAAQSYDGNGNVVGVTLSDATGGDPPRHSTSTHDDNDRVLTTTNAANETTSYSYDDVGNLATTTDGRGAITRFAYTARGQLATTTAIGFVDDPVTPGAPRDVVLESRAYDPAGRLASVTDVLGRTAEYTYYDNDLPNKAVLKGYRESNGSARDIVLEATVYDAAGHVVSQVVNGRTAYGTSYDAAGRVTTTTVDPEGLNRVTTYAYNANGGVVATTMTGGGRTESSWVAYDNADRVLTQTVDNDATADLTTTYVRNQRGEVVAATDARGNTTNYTYDELRRLTLVEEPAVSYESDGAAPTVGRPASTVGYNSFGEHTDVRGPLASVVHSTYDAAGRVTGTSYPSYSPPTGPPITPTESWVYDANGNVVSHTDPRGQTTTSDYDKLNRLVRVTEPRVAALPASGVSRFTYDDAGNVTASTDVTGAVVQATYDDRNRVRTSTAIERVPAPTRVFTTTLGYDDSGNVTSSTAPSGDVATAQYNNADELVAVTNARQNTTAIGRDLMGRVSSITDPLNRSEKRAYDLAGRMTKVDQFDRNNALLTTTSFGYDLAGNPTSATSPLGRTATTAFDAANRPTSITEPISAVDSMTTSFGYDRAGQRTRVTNGRGVSTITKYQSWGLPSEVVEQAGSWTTTYDAGGLAIKVEAPGGVLRTRAYDELGRLTQESGSGGGAQPASRTMSYDLRDVRSVDHPSGTQSFDYDDRGNLVGSSGPAGSSSFAFNGNGQMTSRTDAAGTSTFSYDHPGT